MPDQVFRLIHRTHLERVKKEGKKFLVLVFDNKCGPCKRLKPELFKKVEESDISLGMIFRNQDPDVNKYIGVTKIPYVAAFDGENLLGGIQNSDITITWPFIKEKFGLI